MITKLYAETSPIGLAQYTLTVWTNLPGIRDALRGYAELESEDGDGEHYAFNYRCYTYDDALEVEQIVRDCLRVERLLEGVAL